MKDVFKKLLHDMYERERSLAEKLKSNMVDDVNSVKDNDPMKLFYAQNIKDLEEYIKLIDVLEKNAESMAGASLTTRPITGQPWDTTPILCREMSPAEHSKHTSTGYNPDPNTITTARNRDVMDLDIFEPADNY